MNENAQKIMIVEDDRFLHELCKQRCVKAGYVVVSAFDGENLEARLTKERPDIILLDLLLPKRDGLEILESIKKQIGIQDIPVIIMSNYSDKDRVDKGISLGAKDYIIKAHFTPDDIIQKVQEVLATSK